MKPIHLAVFLFALLARAAVAAPLATNGLATKVALTLSLPAYELADQQTAGGPPSSGFLNETQLPLVVRAPVIMEVTRAPMENEWAERINAEAMRRYRQQWEEFVKGSSVRSVPVLYHESTNGKW